MLVDGHQLDVGEAHVGHVGHQMLREVVPVGQRAPGPAPGTGMHFVDADRRAQGIGLLPHGGAAGHRLGQGHDAARVARMQFGTQRVGVALELPMAIRTEHVELVEGAARKIRNEDLPDAALEPQAHRMCAAVPEVEVPRQADLTRIGRPDRKRHAGHAVYRARVSAQLFPRSQVTPFAQQPDIGIAEPGAEAVRVFDYPLAERRVDLQQVMTGMLQHHVAGEQAAVIDGPQPGQRFAGFPRQHGDAMAAGNVHTQSKVPALGALVRAEAAEWIDAQPALQGPGELELGFSSGGAVCGAGC